MHYLRREDVETFAIKRGPQETPPGEPLEVCLGHDPVWDFTIKHLHPLQDKRAGEIKNVGDKVYYARIVEWKKIAVRVSKGNNPHFVFLVVPDTNEDKVTGGPFYVKGKLRKTNFVKPEEAARVWRDFTPE